jgi:hypothetical protein
MRYCWVFFLLLGLAVLRFHHLEGGNFNFGRKGGASLTFYFWANEFISPFSFFFFSLSISSPFGFPLQT